MRQSILLGRKHGSGEPLTILSGPAHPAEVNRLYKSTLVEGGLAELQLWSSSTGLIKRKLFPAPVSCAPVTPERHPPQSSQDSSSASPSGEGGMAAEDETGPTLLDPAPRRKR